MRVQHFFERRTSTLSYVVHDEASKQGVVIDPVTDFDPKSGRVSYGSCREIAAYVERQGLRIPYVLDTHAHADHLSGMPWLAERIGSKTVIGSRITEVQLIFRDIFHLGPDFPVDGRPFDVLLEDRDVLDVGPLHIEALHTPGHTPACVSYRICDALFVGDTLFMPDYGTARCDFPGGSASTLFDSIQRLYAEPDGTRVFTCHDYRPGGRELRYESSIVEQKRENVQLSARTSREEFVAFRKQRDADLEVPALLLPSVQVNIRAGQLPPPESNGVSYLKIPVAVAPD